MRRLDLVFLVLLLGVAALAVHAFNPRRRLVENEDSKLISMALVNLKETHWPGSKQTDVLLITPHYLTEKRVSVRAILDNTIRGFTMRSMFPEVQKFRDLRMMYARDQKGEPGIAPVAKLDLPSFAVVPRDEKVLAAAAGSPTAKDRYGHGGRMLGRFSVGIPGYSENGNLAAVVIEAHDEPNSQRMYIFEQSDGRWKLLGATSGPRMIR